MSTRDSVSGDHLPPGSPPAPPAPPLVPSPPPPGSPLAPPAPPLVASPPPPSCPCPTVHWSPCSSGKCLTQPRAPTAFLSMSI